jgi:hypothetical protein
VNEKDDHTAWVADTAEYLVCEILEEWAGITVSRASGEIIPTKRMDTVFSHVDGDCRVEMQFRAEPSIFYQMTYNILGEEPESPDEVREFAEEFFNVLCGRFIAEICTATNLSIQLHPPTYQTSDVGTRAVGFQEPEGVVFFMTDKKELAEFSWGHDPLNELLKVGSGQGAAL